MIKPALKSVGNCRGLNIVLHIPYSSRNSLAIPTDMNKLYAVLWGHSALTHVTPRKLGLYQLSRWVRRFALLQANERSIFEAGIIITVAYAKAWDHILCPFVIGSVNKRGVRINLHPWICLKLSLLSCSRVF